MKFIKLTITFVLLLVVCNVKSQKIGIVGGLNLSTLSYEPSVHDNTKLVRKHIGVSVEQPAFVEDIFIQTGFILSQKGSGFKEEYYVGYNSKYTYPKDGGYIYGYSAIKNNDGQTKKKLTYIDIPLLIGYKHSFNKVTLLGKIGPVFSLGIKGKETLGPGNESKIKFDGKDHRLFDTSLDLSLGLELFKKFQILVNYQYGITDIEVDAIQQRNRVLQFSLCYFIGNLNII